MNLSKSELFSFVAFVNYGYSFFDDTDDGLIYIDRQTNDKVTESQIIAEWEKWR